MTAKPLSMSKKSASNERIIKPLKERTSVTGNAQNKQIKLDVTSSTVNRLMAKIKEL